MSALPPSRPEPPDPHGGHVVDAAVLAERRARRAEMGEHVQTQRAKEAEEALTALESEADGMELRLAQAIDAQRRLEDELSARERELRSARQEAYAEQRLRVEVTDRAADLSRGDALARRLREAEARSAGLEDDLEGARRSVDEAAQAIAAADAARRRAEAERDALRQAAERERDRFGAMAVEVETRVGVLRERLDGALTALREQLADERATRRVVEEQLEAERHRGEARHGAAVEAAETAAVLQDELAQRSALQSRVEQVVDGLQTQLGQVSDAASDGRRREAQAQNLLTAAVGDVRDALLSAEARMAEAERNVADAHGPVITRRRGRGDAGDATSGGPRPPDLRAETLELRPPLPAGGPLSPRPPAPPTSSPQPPASAIREAVADLLGAASLAPVETAGGAAAAGEPSAAERGDWLRAALPAMAADAPALALALMEAILPACLGPVADILPCELELPDAVLVLSPPGSGRPAVERISEPRGDARVHVALEVATLAALLAGERPRTLVRRRGPVWALAGGRRRARRLGRLAQPAIGLATLHRAGVYLDPGLAYGALAQAIDPRWTDGLGLSVGQEVLDDPSGPWYVTVGAGERPRVGREPPGRVDAVVRTTRGAFLALLAGQAPPDGAKPSVRGDLRAVGALKDLADRAQGLA